MARMLGKTKLNYRRQCRYAAHGCRCYLYKFVADPRHVAKAHTLLRRSARATEKRAWRAALND